MARGDLSAATPSPSSALVVRAGTASRRSLSGERGFVELLTTPFDAAPALDVQRVVLLPGADPGPVREDPDVETSFVVLAGELEVHAGPDLARLVQGEAIFLPRGVRYAVHNAGYEDCIALVIHDAADDAVTNPGGLNELAPPAGRR